MATDTDYDSRLQFSLGPLADSADSARGNAPPEAELIERAIQFFDLASDQPLPEFDDAPLRPPPVYDAMGRANDASAARANVAEASVRAPGELWLDGDVLMCPCPDCRAPMSIRLWLMIADCWRCTASIELTEEQEREAMRLLEQREQQRRAAAKAAAVKPKPTVPSAPKPAAAAPPRPAAEARAAAPPRTPPPRTAPPARPAPSGQTPQPPAARPKTPTAAGAGTAVVAAPPAPARSTTPQAQRPPAPRRVAAATAPRPARRRIQQQSSVSVAHRAVRDFFRMTPAWLVSLIFHLVLLTLLAMLGPDGKDGPYITLSLTLDSHKRPGGEVIVDPTDNMAFDLPVPDDVDPNNPEQRKAMVRADQDARELRIDPESVNRDLPELSRVKAAIGETSSIHAALAARDPRVRVEMVTKEGGTTLSEAAVARALRWLAAQQRPDGRWNIDGSVNNDMGGTALALLPFLGAGQSHTVGRYQDTVGRGLRWMIDNQKPDGDLQYSGHRNSGMYSHGQAAIVLCEAFALSGDEELRVPAQRAIDFIVKAQHIGGGWRYRPNEPGDTSVVGWQLMALQSARAANLTVPEVTLELSSHYLDSVQSHGGSRYSYTKDSRNSPTHRMTAEALLCRVYLGWKRDEPGLVEGIEWLGQNHPPAGSDIYYWYYATQAFHHFGGEPWERWNSQMRDKLVMSQVTEGRHAGSWNPAGEYSEAGGRLFMTALATCTLEVYYRHLPIFRQIDLD